MLIENLSSPQNPKVKDLLKILESSKERKEKRVIPVEGIREIRLAAKSGLPLQYIFFNPEIVPISEIESFGAPIAYSLTSNLYQKIAYRGSTEGAVGVFLSVNLSLQEIQLSLNPLIIVIESVEKPGNLGAILRTADAVNADAVIICDELTDIYNPNIIRSSIGGVFSNQVVSCNSNDALRWLKNKKIITYAAELQSSGWYHECDFSGATAIVPGTESTGLSNFWIQNADYRIKIPMLGQIDSLNVSVSAAVICYEVMRQRKFKI
jgi:TrmH family RNA methyltransferase